jgi:hypothetical protein
MVPFTAISKYEIGIIRPSSEFLTKMVDIYSVNINWLLTGNGSMFAESSPLAMTGTNGYPHLRLINTGSSFKVQNLKETKLSVSDIKNISLTNLLDSDKQMTKLAQKLQKQLIIEYFEKDIKTEVKVFYPNGTIELIFSQNEANENNIDNLKQKIEKLAGNKDKLEFVKLAISALEDQKSLSELKNIIKGIELAREGI